MKIKLLLCAALISPQIVATFVPIKLPEQFIKTLKLIARTTKTDRIKPFFAHYRPDELYIARIKEGSATHDFAFDSNNDIEHIAAMLDYRNNGEIEWSKKVLENSLPARVVLRDLKN